MDDGCRIQRRLHRPKPYDLRRKVLLKNFLREQMTHTPHINEAEVNNISNNANANENASSTTTDEDQNNSKENKCDSSSDCINSETRESDAVVDGQSNITLTEQNKEKGKHLFNFPLPKSRFASIMSLSNRTKKSRNKGKFKAKYICKNSVLKEKKQKNPTSSAFSSINESKEKHFKENTYKNPKNSIMHKIFKSARQKRRYNKNVLDNTKLNNNCNNTSTQSVQTDLSMSFKELDNVEQDNMLLREENKYLYERLALFVSEAPSTSLNKDDSTTTLAASSNCSFDGLHKTLFSFGKETSTKTELKIDTLLEKKNIKEVASSVASSPKLVDLNFRPKSPKLCRYSGTLSRLSLQNNNYKRYSISFSSPLKESSRLGINGQNWKMKAKATCSFPSIKKSKTSTLLNKYSIRKVKRNSSMPVKSISKKINIRSCRRSESVRNNTVPFHDLPVDAFY